MAVTNKQPNLPPVADYISNTKPYPPGKPIKELERELGISDIIKVASNENPLGASPLAKAALKNCDLNEELRLYPDAGHYYLREKLARENSVDIDEILVGNGSNEVIDLLVRTYCRPGDNVVSCAAAFVAYRICAAVHGVEYRDPPITDDLQTDLQAMLDLVDDNTRIVFLPNPNNPTGSYVNKADLDAFVDRLQSKNILVVLDYAYWEYVQADDLPDANTYMRDFHNVIVTRTFSKIYGMAGLRVGYGMAHPDVWKPVFTVKMPFNVSTLGLVAAEAAVGDTEFVKKSYDDNSRNMDILFGLLDEIGVRHFPSQGNFVLVRLKTDPLAVCQKMMQKGVIVRPVAGYRLKEHLRLSIGTEAETRRMVEALGQCL